MTHNLLDTFNNLSILPPYLLTCDTCGCLILDQGIRSHGVDTITEMNVNMRRILKTIIIMYHNIPSHVFNLFCWKPVARRPTDIF